MGQIKSVVSRPIIVVQGAAWGSEAKGAVAGYLCQERKVNLMVRTGAINAGHTVYYRGKPYKMQQLPVGWINPKTKLVIGAGAYIHVPTLAAEIEMINRARGSGDVRDDLLIDYRAALHTEGDEETSKLANRHHLIGATGKGCSSAIISKISGRGVSDQILFRDHPYAKTLPALVDTEKLLNEAYDDGLLILLEGTQGTLLDMHLGPYPYTTSRMTTPANWAAEAGLSPALEYEVVLVVRTYPIRVAGNSGPMPRETNWVDLAREINRKRNAVNWHTMVPEWALVEFEEELKALKTVYGLPDELDPVRQEMWSAEARFEYRVAL